MNRWSRFIQLWQLTVAYFRELIREPGVLFWGILFPILMSAGLGMAFTKKADVIRKIAVILPSDSPGVIKNSSALSSFLDINSDTSVMRSVSGYNHKIVVKDEKLGNSIFLFYEMNWRDAMMQLKRGTVNVVLLEKEGLTEYHFDPLNSDAQLTYLKLNSLIGEGKIVPRESDPNIKPLTVTGTRYIDFLVPGLITMGVMMSCMWGISYGIIEKRSKKLLRRLVATPMKKSHFLIAMISVRTLMNVIESVVLFIFAMIAFKMVVQGSILALFLLYLAGNVAFSGIAVLVSSHTSNTEVGNGLINVVVMPMMVLSGIFFSYHNFPDWSLPVIQKFPLTMMTDGVRSIINEGAGFGDVWLSILILTATGVVFFIAGLKIFKWH
ncbi:MAG: ABC transporter permease [Bacteroidales bacterium]